MVRSIDLFTLTQIGFYQRIALPVQSIEDNDCSARNMNLMCELGERAVCNVVKIKSACVAKLSLTANCFTASSLSGCEIESPAPQVCSAKSKILFHASSGFCRGRMELADSSHERQWRRSPMTAHRFGFPVFRGIVRVRADAVFPIRSHISLVSWQRERHKS